MTSRSYGKTAYKLGILTPTQDSRLSLWLQKNPDAGEAEHYMEWWEGWFEGLNAKMKDGFVSFTGLYDDKFMLN